MTNTASSDRDGTKHGSSKAQQMMSEAKATALATGKEGARAVESRVQMMASAGIAKAEEQLRGLSHALEITRTELEQESHPLAGTFGSAQDRVDDIARGLAARDPGELVGEAERFARRNPWLFLGGCFVAGVALSRFLKASDPEPQLARGSEARSRVHVWEDDGGGALGENS